MNDHIRILIVEDNPNDVLLMERAIKKDGISFESRTVDSKPAFLKELDEYHPHIVISDFTLVRFNALDVLSITKTKYPTMPVILVTGTLNDVQAVNCIKAGADDYILKDRLARLGTAIRSALDSARKLEEKLKIEKLLEKKEAQLRSLFARMTNGFAIHEMVFDGAGKAVDFTYLDVNDAFENISGLQKKNIIGKRVTEVFPAIRETSPDWIKLFGNVVQTGKDFIVEQYIEPFQKWLYIAMFKTGDQQVAALFHDLTKRKAAELELQRRLELEQLVSSISTFFISNLHRDIDVGIAEALEKTGNAMEVDRSGIFLWENDHSDMCCGYEWHAAGIPPLLQEHKQFQAGDYPWRMKRLQQLETIVVNSVETLPAEAAMERRELDALGIQSFITVPLIHAGSLIGFLRLETVTRDRIWLDDDIIVLKLIGEILANAIEHKRMEDQLKTSEKQFFLVFNSSPVLMSIHRYSDGRFVLVNDCFAAATGYTREEIIGKTVEDLQLLIDQSNLWNMSKTLLDNHVETHDQELEIRTKSGTMRTVLASVELLTMKNEVFVLSVLKDITDRKQMENMLIQSDKMAAIGTLSAGITHELNNPLGYVYGNLDMLGIYHQKICDYQKGIENFLEDLRLSGNPDYAEKITSLIARHNISFLLSEMGAAVKDSKEGAERMRRIIRNLNEFARIEKPAIALADLNQSIDKVIDIVWNELKYKAKVIRRYEEIPAVECDVHKIEQVMMNLLVNAAHAIEKEGEITIHTARINDHIKVQVSDTGKGIPKAIINRIFDAFFTTKEPGKGTGLGLSISYRIVQDHHGTITVESEEGKGATFVIMLPVRQTQKIATEKPD